MTYQLDEKGEIRAQHLLGETVILSEKDCRGLRDSTLTSGTLKLAQRSSKWPIIIVRSTVKDSEVIAVKDQKGDRLFQARFINCRFHGLFSGVDFGSTDRSQLGEDFGGAEGCDFTDATLDGCRFFNVDASTLRFPAWPHVVLHDFAKRTQDVVAATWPRRLGQYMRVCADQPESMRVSVIHVPSVAKLVGCTEQQVREAFEKIGLVK